MHLRSSKVFLFVDKVVPVSLSLTWNILIRGLIISTGYDDQVNATGRNIDPVISVIKLIYIYTYIYTYIYIYI